MALRAGYKGIKKYIADKLNLMNPGDSFATDAEIAAATNQVRTDIATVLEEAKAPTGGINAGDQFYLNDILYIATADIAEGANIVVTGEGKNADVSSNVTQQLTTEVQQIYADNGITGAKNFMPFILSEIKAANTTGTWAGNVYTHPNGLTITFNDDGTISVSGTAAVTTYVWVCKKTDVGSYFLKEGLKYIISGEPSGHVSDTRVQFEMKGVMVANSTDNNGEFTAPTFDTTASILLRINSGDVFSNEVFKPMIRLASDTDPTYQPYAMTNQQLTGAAAALDAVKVKSDTFSGTTNVSGNVAITTDTNRKVLAAYIEDYIVLTYKASSYTGAHVVSASSLDPVAETAVSGTYYYI